MRTHFFRYGLYLLLAAGSASAGVLCSDTGTIGGNTLDKYQALGSGGCTIGTLLFSNFSYSYSVSPTGVLYDGTQQNADAVTVSIDNLNLGLSFGANWIVGETQTASLSLSFTVSAPSGLVDNLQNVYTGISSGSDNGGPIVTPLALCANSTCGVSTDFTNVSLPISPTAGPITISNTVSMNANGGSTESFNSYHLSIIQDQFAETAPPGDAPEPLTYGLTGLGIAAFAAIRRFKKA